MPSAQDDYEDEDEQYGDEDKFSDASSDEDNLEFPETLPEPLTTNQSIRHLYDLIVEGKIDLDPEYQRAKRMAGLINSLFNNFYIPPVIFSTSALVRSDDHTQAEIFRVCVDGKQRLTTLKRFMDGDIPYTDHRKRQWFYVNNSGKKRRVLSDKIRQEFDQYHILCIEYRRLSRAQEEDLFGRVQNGIPLTPAEKLSASTSPYHKIIYEIKKNCNHASGLLETRRQRDFQFIAMALIMMRRREGEEDFSTPIKYPSTTNLKDMMGKERTLPPSFRLMAMEIFNKYDKLVKDHPDAFTHSWDSPKSKKFSPVEFIAVAILLYSYRNRSIPELAGDVKALRHYIRGQAADLRSNSTIWNYVWKFVEDMKSTRGAIPYKGAKAVSNQSSKSSKGRVVDTPTSSRPVTLEIPIHTLPSKEESARPRKRIRVFDTHTSV